MAVAKYIYFPGTQDTKEDHNNGNNKKAYQKNSCLLLFYVTCLLVHFFWKGMMGKCQQVKRSIIQNFMFTKTFALSLKASSVLQWKHSVLAI